MDDWNTANTSDMTTAALCRVMSDAFSDLPDSAVVSLSPAHDSPRISIKVGDLRQMVKDTQKLTCLWTNQGSFSGWTRYATGCGGKTYATTSRAYCHLCGNRCEVTEQ